MHIEDDGMSWNVMNQLEVKYSSSSSSDSSMDVPSLLLWIILQQYDKHFWKGLPSTIQPHIEAWLLQLNPTLDVSIPF